MLGVTLKGQVLIVVDVAAGGCGGGAGACSGLP